MADLAELGRAAGELGRSARPKVRIWEGFFFTLARATHNTLLPGLEESLWRSLGDPLSQSLEMVREDPALEEELKGELLGIYEAVENGDPGIARRTTEGHLRHLERILRNGTVGL